MTAKDYIVLLVPIILNGLIVFIAQKLLSRKIERINKRQDIRDDIVKVFWNKLQALNDSFIQMNIEAARNPETINNNLENLQKIILELIKYYDTNKFDLNVFSNSFENVQNKWNHFEIVRKEYSDSVLTREMQENLGNKMQAVKEANQNLIDEVRKKY